MNRLLVAHRLMRSLLVALPALILVPGVVAAAPPASAQASGLAADPVEELERYLIQEKIEFDEAAVHLYQKLLDAGCKPEQAIRWTKMALFVDSSWNLSEVTGVVEEQLATGATRQVVEDEVERLIGKRAAELQVDLAGFASSTQQPKKGATKPVKTKAPAAAPDKKP